MCAFESVNLSLHLIAIERTEFERGCDRDERKQALILNHAAAEFKFLFVPSLCATFLFILRSGDEDGQVHVRVAARR